jgi:glyoxylase I family protein
MSTPDPIKGVSHVSLSVSDLDMSLTFYRDALRLPVLREPYEGTVFAGREAMLHAGRVVITLQAHTDNAGEAFDPTRTGLDHLAFHLSSRNDLEDWIEHLDRSQVLHSDVIEVTGYGWMIELRDPDGIQLELFATK